MPWSHELGSDDVEYSDCPVDDGPAPGGDDVHRGDVAELTVTDGTEHLTLELQFWQPLWTPETVAHDMESKAGYLAWRLDDQSGAYGVLDGYAKRVWFGLERPSIGGPSYSFTTVGHD
ncbi:hypothetical protein [Halomarina rubra]|uniref:Uncharacterized protein n=1 Tax=Halomarina rubra TaxID=2071873 RepID=A0ABD6AVT7_9EURY|nr:hypothetical protein [Halomarina rubra]